MRTPLPALSSLVAVLRSISIALLLCSQGLAGDGAPPEIKRIEFRGVTYHLVTAEPAQVRILWLDADGRKLGTIPSAARELRKRGERPFAITNGGIFEPGHVPSGLLVQDGKALRPINRRVGKGNFFLKPNGVFWIAGGKAGVGDAAEFDPKTPALTQAVQSGPLLLKAGATHPAFNKESKSRLHRNGIGIAADGRVVIAMSEFRQEGFPNLWEFADLFRSLGCKDALFLDGDLCQLRNGEEVDRRSNLFASMIAVVAPAERPE